MKRKVNVMSIGVIILLTISGIASFKLYQKMKPSTKVMELEQYYNVEKNVTDSAVLVLQDRIDEESKVLIVNDEKYVEYGVINSEFTTKFFWDEENQTMIATTPTEILNIQPGSKDYTANGTKKTYENVILKTDNEKKYLALSFVDDFCNLEYTMYENPNRLVMNYTWGEEILKTNVEKTAEIRYQADDGSDILKKVEAGTKLKILTETSYISQNFTKVMSDDGIIGYIRTNKISDSYYEKLENTKEYKGQDYTTLADGKKVSMGWFNVDNYSANEANYSSWMKGVSGLNVIAPTWLSLKDSSGNISSIANNSIVTKAHTGGMDVWVVINDFSENVKLLDILSHTSSRTNFIKNIISNVTTLGADGVNIDFEHITEESSPYYIQFIRELSVSCRNKSLVLSVDSYVPVSYNSFYNIGEQSEVIDYVVIMAYDQTKGSTEIGSSSSIGWVKTAINGALDKDVPNSKLVIGLPFYYVMNYLTSSGTLSEMEDINMTNTSSILSGVEKTWDEEYKQNHVKYTNSKGVMCEAWIEDKDSLKAKLDLVQQNQVAGVGFWRLGYETNDVWDVISNYVKQ